MKVFSHEALRKFCREKAAAPREPAQLSFKINAKTTRCGSGALSGSVL
jgi:hypothetical protein